MPTEDDWSIMLLSRKKPDSKLYIDQYILIAKKVSDKKKKKFYLTATWLIKKKYLTEEL